MMVRRVKYPFSPDDLPDWMRPLRGFELITNQWRDNAEGNPNAQWHVGVTGARDPSTDLDKVDPIVMLVGLAFAVARIEDRMVQVVGLCRTEGKSWTQIGEALGMTKQSAWERYSGED